MKERPLVGTLRRGMEYAVTIGMALLSAYWIGKGVGS